MAARVKGLRCAAAGLWDGGSDRHVCEVLQGSDWVAVSVLGVSAPVLYECICGACLLLVWRGVTGC